MIHTKKVITRYNIAFKCNYCDGGKSSEQIGFNGVCSDSIIYNNIYVEKRAWWCSNEDCLCKQYIDGRIPRYKLEETMNDHGFLTLEEKMNEHIFLCYESQMLRVWCAYAGSFLHGQDEGQTRKLLHVQPYGICVLTTRDPGSGEESERYIFAAFLIDEIYKGGSRESGHVATSSEYKIKLSHEEAHAMPFWKYHANGKQPYKAAWGTGLYRYFKDDEAAFILRDIADIKKGTKDESLANKFYKYFCQKNGINLSPESKPNGAFYRSSDTY
jgi:hypothetical protein